MVQPRTVKRQFTGEQFIFFSLLVTLAMVFSGYAGHSVNFTQGCAKHKPILAV